MLSLSSWISHLPQLTSIDFYNVTENEKISTVVLNCQQIHSDLSKLAFLLSFSCLIALPPLTAYEVVVHPHPSFRSNLFLLEVSNMFVITLFPNTVYTDFTFHVLTSYFDVTKASSHPLGKKPMSRDPGGLSVAMSWWTYIGQDYKSEGVNLLSGLLQWLSDKESACQCRKHGFSPWVRKIPWSRKW